MTVYRLVAAAAIFDAFIALSVLVVLWFSSRVRRATALDLAEQGEIGPYEYARARRDGGTR